ncbi:MAG: GatB/YqeY domain-containing protein [Gammaproteobacteria bacterium]|nr:GatB/YqeY domain-containing protein [Gammaproteobacteria bacterium]
MSLKSQITEDMKAAMRAKDQDRLGAIRMLQAAIQRREVDERTELDDDQVVAVIEKMIKQGRDAIRQYEDGGRPELAEKEQNEIAIWEKYLPEQLSEAEVAALIAEAIKESGADGVKDMGKVMGVLKPRLAGKADMGKVSGQVKTALSGGQ